MESVMKGLFGGGDEEEVKKQVAQAEDFEKRYQEGDPTEGYSTEEAVDYYKKVAANASPEQLQKATQQAVEKLTPEQRAEFASMLQQRQSGQVQQRSGAEAGAAGGSGGIEDILGSLMGGLGGATPQGGGATSANPTGGLTDVLNSFLGGGGGQPGATAQSGATAQAQGGGFDLGDILGSPVAKAVLAGVAAFGMKELAGR